MKTMICIIVYILSTAFLIAFPAGILSLIFHGTYHAIVTNSAYIFFFGVSALIASGFVVDELYQKLNV
jgi:hypothetical protein